jgi:hypothetical protein
MRAVAGTLNREPAIAMIIGALAILAAASASGYQTEAVAPLVLGFVIFSALHRSLLRWHSLVGLILAVVLFVPITKYRLPANLPFNLELYRLVVALVVLAWVTSLLIDPRVRLRRTYFDAPILMIVLWALASEVANPGRVDSLSSYVAKTLTFFLSFVFVYYVTASVIKRRSEVLFLLRFLVLGCCGIAVAALVEQRTGYNVFYHLHSIAPFLQFQGGGVISRFGRLRVLGSAQHPIALGAMLAVPVPIAVYFARTAGRKWWGAVAILLLGALATGSRTAIVMLIAIGIVLLRLKPRETRRIWPALIPAIAVVHVIVPGAIGTIREAFFPQGGIIAEQSRLAPGEDPNLAGGRIRQLGPMLREAAGHPLFGEGVGTRITGFGNNIFRNAPILDNQWLNTVLEFGYVGVAFWFWLFIRSVRRLFRASREAEEDGDDWLFAALAAAITGYGVGMFTYDAFGFTQITFVFWILLGLSAAMLRITQGAQTPRTAGQLVASERFAEPQSEVPQALLAP